MASATGRRTRSLGKRCATRLFRGDVLGQLQVHGPGSLLFRHAERLPHSRRNGRTADNSGGVLREGAHHLNHVHDLEVSLFARLDGLLPRDHQQRHATQLGVRRSGYEIRRPGTKGGHAHPGLAGEAAVRSGHETRRLLVPGENDANARIAKRLEQVQVLLAGDGEDKFHALGLEGLYEKI